jgi:hypothetical protein
MKTLLAALFILTAAIPAMADNDQQNDQRKNQLREMGIIRTDKCDIDCDGKLDLKELQALGLENDLPEGVSVDTLDKDKDGFISEAELEMYYDSEIERKDRKRKNLQQKARDSHEPKIHF